MEAEIMKLYRGYRGKYHSSILPNDFQHALFCLAGLMKMELISFVLEGQNNPKFFIPNGVTPPLPPRLLKPRRTSGDWTVDCFLARFGKFEMMFRAGYERWPNPIAWLEAEMDREEIQGQRMKPWKLVVEKGEKEPKDPPAVDWEILQRLTWATRGNYSYYPKPKPLIVSPPFFNMQASLYSLLIEHHYPRNYNPLSSTTSSVQIHSDSGSPRKDKKQAAKRLITVDLTGDASSEHMNQPAVPGPRSRCLDDTGSGYTGDESDLASPMDRKKKDNGSGGTKITRRIDAGDESFPTIEQLQHLGRVKQEEKLAIVLEDDLYGVSDRKDDRQGQRQRKRARHRSPSPKTFKMPSMNFSSPQGNEQEDLPFRAGPEGSSLNTSSSGVAQKSGSTGGHRRLVCTTSSPESDCD
jgi:hypothetical protein